MNRAIIIAVICLALIVGCLEDNHNTASSHCYLAVADYLANGREWPGTGRVSKTFFELNSDPGLELFYTNDVNQHDVQQWLDDGFRVAIQYRSSKTTHHAIPIHSASQCEGKTDLWVYVAGHFDLPMGNIEYGTP